jgi:hypothetical protein
VDTEINLAKRGETVLQMSLGRGPKGLKVKVKAHNLIESLMQNWAPRAKMREGQTEADPLIVPVSSYDRYWTPIGEGDLLTYAVGEVSGPFPYANGQYSLAAFGQPLRLERSDTINLSFLRLVGISSGSGVGFYVNGIYSLPEARKIKESIEMAAVRFYTDYLLPVNLELSLMTQEVRL